VCACCPLEYGDGCLLHCSRCGAAVCYATPKNPRARKAVYDHNNAKLVCAECWESNAPVIARQLVSWGGTDGPQNAQNAQMPDSPLCPSVSSVDKPPSEQLLLF
jgi:hypothetical protein